MFAGLSPSLIEDTIESAGSDIASLGYTVLCQHRFRVGFEICVTYAQFAQERSQSGEIPSYCQGSVRSELRNASLRNVLQLVVKFVVVDFENGGGRSIDAQTLFLSGISHGPGVLLSSGSELRRSPTSSAHSHTTCEGT